MDELQAGVEPALTVLPEPPALLQPGKVARDNPASGHDLEGVQFTKLGNLHRDHLTQYLARTLREGLTHIGAVTQYAFDLSEPRLTASQRLQSIFDQ